MGEGTFDGTLCRACNQWEMVRTEKDTDARRRQGKKLEGQINSAPAKKSAHHVPEIPKKPNSKNRQRYIFGKRVDIVSRATIACLRFLSCPAISSLCGSRTNCAVCDAVYYVVRLLLHVCRFDASCAFPTHVTEIPMMSSKSEHKNTSLDDVLVRWFTWVHFLWRAPAIAITLLPPSSKRSQPAHICI